MAVPHDKFQQHFAEMLLLLYPLSSLPLPQADFLEDTVFDLNCIDTTVRHRHAAHCAVHQGTHTEISNFVLCHPQLVQSRQSASVQF